MWQEIHSPCSREEEATPGAEKQRKEIWGRGWRAGAGDVWNTFGLQWCSPFSLCSCSPWLNVSFCLSQGSFLVKKGWILKHLEDKWEPNVWWLLWLKGKEINVNEKTTWDTPGGSVRKGIFDQIFAWTWKSGFSHPGKWQGQKEWLLISSS